MFEGYESTQPADKSVWEYVSHSPLEGLWNLRGVPARVIAKRVWDSTLEDNLFGRASQLAYYFFFALFPMLIAASALLGFFARSATELYGELLHRMSVFMPPSAFAIVMETFNQTAQHATRGKVTLGILTALWSASVGISAIQDTLNAVYKVKETRSYWRARAEAILLTVAVTIVFTFALSTLVGADLGAFLVQGKFTGAVVVAWLTRIVGWIAASLIMLTVLAMLYFFSPDLRKRKWRWLTPGSAIGLSGALIGSLGLRLYLHYFNSYTLTYGSLGAVIILLTWFYAVGLMLLVGAEVNSEIEAAVVEREMPEKAHSASTVAT